MIKIEQFHQINLDYNSLLVLDIDETIIKYKSIHKTWWQESITSENIAHAAMLNKWEHIISTEVPILIDEQGFNDLLAKAEQFNCDVIYITARREHMYESTKHHFELCGLNFDNVYFSEDKGMKLNEILDKKNKSYSKIIFVDDLKHNLNNVEKTFNYDKNVKLELYHIKHK